MWPPGFCIVYADGMLIALLSIVLLLAITIWKVWRVRRDTSTLMGTGVPAKPAEAQAVARVLSDTLVTASMSQEDRDSLKLLHRRVQLSAHKAKTENQQKWMAVGVTVVLGSAALFVVLSKQYDQDSLKWAFGALGTIIGYWLKG
jgi:hypothetical protein